VWREMITGRLRRTWRKGRIAGDGEGMVKRGADETIISR
jgi:hypothetical protein